MSRIDPAMAIHVMFRTIPQMFKTIPDLRRSFIEIIPVLNTIALAGVATGKQKANEQLTQVGTMRNSGFILIATAVEATMGSMMDATAAFEVNSVIKVTMVPSNNIARYGGKEPRLERFLAIKSVKLVAENPPDNAKPPPSKSRMSQGICLITVSHSNNLVPTVRFLAGIKNIKNEVKSTTVPSDIKLGCPPYQKM